MDGKKGCLMMHCLMFRLLSFSPLSPGCHGHYRMECSSADFVWLVASLLGGCNSIGCAIELINTLSTLNRKSGPSFYFVKSSSRVSSK